MPTYCCRETLIHRIRWCVTVVIATVCACSSPRRLAESAAAAAGLAPVLINGSSFRHRSFARLDPRAGSLLVVFVEGDGSPWVGGGRKIASDPTPRMPLALRLAAITPGSVLYLGRPCYFEPAMPAGCSEELWTSARYSRRIVDSMASAAQSFAAAHRFSRIVLVGYSGGGTLATLMAPAMPSLAGLVSVAGNLDPDAWTRLHGYLPLDGLNPALQPPLNPALSQWYLTGERDTNVPAQVNERYLRRVSPDRIWSYPRFDHKCCWERLWPAIYARISAEGLGPVGTPPRFQ
jgi:pimeloyl-ACP methyl ester carboxylesterase